MKILIIDNYDSFTYNLYQVCGELLLESKTKNNLIDVVRNDAITVAEIKKRTYDKIILSPGPGDPSDKAYFGVCADVLVTLGKTTPVLGVCLGMQGLAHYYGGKVIKAQKPMHGKTSVIHHNATGVFAGVPQKIAIMRYHSLIVEKESLPECLAITAQVEETGEIMGLRHKHYPIVGVQFHPESFATDAGKTMLGNFLR
jgi:anthranilate synthase component 2